MRDRGLKRLEAQIEASLQLIETRRQLIPKGPLRGDLPILERAEEIQKAIRDHPVVVLCGETGSGKTTQIPQLALRAGQGVFGLIGHTQPRRLAARAIAQRLTEEIGGADPPRVGFQVRFRKDVSASTLIKVMTDGILLAELADDPRLEQYDTIIIDEAHERSLNIDLLMGVLKRILPRRPDLRVIITSATIDAKRFSDFFDGAPVIEVSGRQYDVEILHGEDLAQSETPEVLTAAVGDTMREVLRRYPEAGDVLVFLPGEREIRDVARGLEGPFARHFEIVPLYARLSLAAQQRALRPVGPRRIVLATNVAETSLTVPRIRAVIDSGLVRMKRFSARRGIERLPVEGVSRASARQRAGRAGRLAPGTCFRLYSEAALAKRDAFTAPEILRTNLSAVILRLADLGLGTLEDFPLLDRPRGPAIRAGEATLRELDAVDARGRLTDLGRQMATLPVDPRLARMLLAAADTHCLDDVLAIASGLATPDPRLRPPGEEAQADRLRAVFTVDGSDFLTLRNLWRGWVKVLRRGSGSDQRRWCQAHALSWTRMREWREIHDQLRRMMRESGRTGGRHRASDQAIHRALLTGLITNVGGRARPAPGGSRPEKGLYEGPGRRRFKIHPSSNLARTWPAWIMGAELVETTRLWARTVAQVDPAWIESVGRHLLEPAYGDPFWDDRRGAAMTTMQWTLQGLTLPGERIIPQAGVDAVIAREIFIEEALVRGPTLDLAFHQHNRSLQVAIEQEEDRLRRRDLLAAEIERAAFYDTRLPEDVVDLTSLKRWLRRANPAQRRVLEMTVSDLRQQEVPVAADHFPSTLSLAGVECPVRYGFDPGTDRDGLSVSIPLAILSRVPPGVLDWLVPGLLPDKIEAIIRGLDKESRRRCQPVAETVAWCVDSMREAAGPFAEVLAERLRTRTGCDVTASSITAIALAPHLHASIEVVDDGEVIARGRNLGALIRECAARAETDFTSAAAGHPRTAGTHVSWTFGRLYEPVSLEVGGQAIATWTAIVDQGGAVGVVLSESLAEATQRSRRGLARLFLLAMEGSVEFQIENLPDLDRLRLEAAPCLAGGAVEAGLAVLSAESIFLSSGGASAVTTADAFTARLDAGRAGIATGVIETGILLRTLLEARTAVAARLESPPPAGGERLWRQEQQHLERLFVPDVLLETPRSWLAQYPRWLTVMLRRLDSQADPLDPELAVWETRLDGVWRGTGTDPAVRQLAWLLEEWRIRRQSPATATAVKVTPEMVQQQWSVVSRRR